MSLIDDLRAAADTLPPSHVPVTNEVLGLLGAWIAYAEHGIAFLEAAKDGPEAVAKLWAPPAPAEPEAAPAEPAPAPEPAPSEPAPAAPAAPTVSELEAQLAQAQAALAAAQGAEGHPTVTTEEPAP